jgi:hypothetical protein
VSLLSIIHLITRFIFALYIFMIEFNVTVEVISPGDTLSVMYRLSEWCISRILLHSVVLLFAQ